MSLLSLCNMACPFLHWSALWSLSFLITAIVLTIAGATLFYINARDSLKEKIFSHLQTTAVLKAEHIKTLLKSSKNSIKQFSKSVVIKQFLQADKEDEDYDKKLNSVKERLKNTVAVIDHIYDIFVLNKEGVIVVSSEERDIG